MKSIALLVVFGLFVIGIIVQIAFPSPHQTVFQTKTPRGWQVLQRADSSDPLKLVFAIKQNNIDLLQTTLYEVSDPHHPKFGLHLTLDQVDELTANYQGAKIVEEFLLSNGVASEQITTAENAGFITVELAVGFAERLLRTEFMKLQHVSSRKTTIKTNVFSVPTIVAEHLDFVTANCLFPSTARPTTITAHKPISFAPNPYPGFAVPSFLFSYYGIDNPIVANKSSTQSVFEYLGQSFDPADLTNFQKAFNVSVGPVAKVVGKVDSSICAQDTNQCAEASLDLQFLMAVAQKSPTTFWSINSNDQHPYLDWIMAISKDATAPLVHSVSYTDVELDDDLTIMMRFDQELQKLGVRGITVIVASGDDGVAGVLARSDSTQCAFNPVFPASSPHVTAVGATQGPESNSTEIACTSNNGSLITTGGGFSYNFVRPTYQAKAVKAFLNTSNLPPESMYNSGGRAYPDVAMLGNNYFYVVGGAYNIASGTSASAPVFAAVITLINGLRMQKHKPPLGFLNQILYDLAATKPSVYRDITSGENNCCAGAVVCCKYGFVAGKGWDPLTGLGGIHYPSFSEALIAL